MADVVLFRSGEQARYLPSVHTGDYISDPDAVINPNLSLVIAVPTKYWKRVVNTVVEMTVGEKAAVDAAGIVAANDSRIAELQALTSTADILLTIEEDWLCSVIAGKYSWVSVVSGAGALASINTGLSDGTHPGILQLSTGTTATGRASMHLGNNSLSMGNGVSIFEALVRLEDLSDGSNTYKFYIGWGDITGAGNMQDGVYFSYTHTENSGQWQGNAANNNARSTTVGGSAMTADTWYKLQIRVISSGSSATFFVNGISIGTLNTNIPITAARNTGPLMKLEKTVGLVARLAYVDYYVMQKAFSTLR